jgi:hypothetical protein
LTAETGKFLLSVEAMGGTIVQLKRSQQTLEEFFIDQIRQPRLAL